MDGKPLNMTDMANGRTESLALNPDTPYHRCIVSFTTYFYYVVFYHPTIVGLFLCIFIVGFKFRIEGVQGRRSGVITTIPTWVSWCLLNNLGVGSFG